MSREERIAAACFIACATVCALTIGALLYLASTHHTTITITTTPATRTTH
jgi:hypothetical protein